MAVGSDSRVLASKETTYGTRVAPARALPGLTSEDNGFEIRRYFSNVIGSGRNTRPSVITSRIGRGSFSGEVPTIGFSYLVDLLHSNTVTPALVVTGVYTHTHILNSPITKSLSAQVQMPPVTSATLIPHDLLGMVAGGLTLSWDADGVLTYQLPTIYQDLDTSQALETYTAPTAYSLFSGQSTTNTLTFGGATELYITGGGSIEIGYGLREAFYFGGGGKVAKPAEEAKPTYRFTATKDFVDNTNLTRVLNNTSGDLVLKFQHGTAITSTHFPYVQITIPDCVVTSPRATVSGPGVVQESVVFEAASATNNAPQIQIKTSESTV